MLVGKIWGTTELLLSTPLCEIHRLGIKPNHQCSLHKHNYKWNAFYVLSGTLYIDVEKKEYKLVDTTKLSAGDITTVPPGEYHRFRTWDDTCLALEIYYCEPLAKDIHRLDVGGPIGEGHK